MYEKALEILLSLKQQKNIYIKDLSDSDTYEKLKKKFFFMDRFTQ